MDIDMDKANKDGTSPAYIRAQLGNIDDLILMYHKLSHVQND